MFLIIKVRGSNLLQDFVVDDFINFESRAHVGAHVRYTFYFPESSDPPKVVTAGKGCKIRK